jgi:hypothetical protein
MVKRWDEQSQAYVEPVNVPMRYDEDSQAYVETTGMAWDAESHAWTERWNSGVSACVYGAASETVTIKKNGIIVATVATNSSGCSNEKISLVYGTYTLTGSVSGWTEEQTVDESTTKFRAMPDGALYWYGNECTDVTGGWSLGSWTTFNTSAFAPTEATKKTNCIYAKADMNNTNLVGTTNKISFNAFTKICATAKGVNISTVAGEIGFEDSKVWSGDVSTMPISTASLVSYSASVLDMMPGKYINFASHNNRSAEMYAIWLE